MVASGCVFLGTPQHTRQRTLTLGLGSTRLPSCLSHRLALGLSLVPLVPHAVVPHQNRLRLRQPYGLHGCFLFNTSKTQLLTISLSNTPSNYPIIFEDSEIPPLNSVNILGLQISSSLSWRDHIVQIAKSASKKLGVLFCCKQYFNAAQLFKLYTGFIRPCLEYCSHIWGSSLILLFLIGLNQRLST